MLPPDGISLQSPFIIVGNEGLSVFITKIQQDWEAATVLQPYTGSAYAVDDAVIFNKNDAMWFYQDDRKYYVVDETKIAFKIGTGA